MPSRDRSETSSLANPSSITQAAIDKAIEAAVGVIIARIDAMQKAQDLFQADLTRVPTTVDRQITALRELIESRIVGIDTDLILIHKTLDKQTAAMADAIQHLRDLVFGKIEELASVTTERFMAVAAQFSERDTRTDQRAGDTKLAVDAAFAAAKEATAKIEAGFTKQIDGMSNIIDTKTANLAGGLGDLKDRMTAMENRAAGMSSSKGETRNDSADARSNIAIVVAMVAIGVTLLIHFMK